MFIYFLGLMLCCADEYLKNDAYTYLYEFVRVIIRIALYHFSGVSHGRSLEVNPYVLIDAVTIILSNERESVFDTGLFVTVFIIEELRIVFGDNVCDNSSMLKLNFILILRNIDVVLDEPFSIY